MHRPIRHRRGQILFLEYTGLLPIFCMFFLFSVSFHLWYVHVREANAHAHFSVTRKMDNHWIDPNSQHFRHDEEIFRAVRLNNGQLQENGQQDIEDPLARQDPLGFNHIVVKRYGAVSVRNVRLPKLGQGAPVGTGFASRDSWCHRDINDQTGTAVSEAQPYIFYENEAGGDLPKEFLRL